MNAREPGARARLPHAGWWRIALGLSLTPGAGAIAGAALSETHVGSRSAGVIAFAGATLVPILGLAIAATSEAALSLSLGIATSAVAALLAVACLHAARLAAVLVVDTALVAVAWAVGSSIGRRVQHASHLLPACVVAASADVVSLLSPEGPTHAIAQSDRALSVLAVWFPVPGTHAVAPALGVGDLVFMALVFGVARAHALPYARTVLLCTMGTCIAGLGAAWLGVAVPALVPIAAALLVGLPMVRKVRRADRTAAGWSMLIALSIVAATVVRVLLFR